MNPQVYTKFIVSVLGAVVAYIGLEIDEKLLTQLALIITPPLVYMFENKPNKKVR